VDKQTEALKQALEALENMSTALREDDVLGSDIELMLNTITAIHKALAQPDEDAIIIQYHEATIKRLEAFLSNERERIIKVIESMGTWAHINEVIDEVRKNA
jgi:hypothetical protein